MNELKEQLMKLSYKDWTHVKRDVDMSFLQQETFEESKDKEDE